MRGAFRHTISQCNRWNVQRKFTNKLLLFMVMLWIGKMWRSGAVNSPRTDVHDEQRSGGPSLISDDRFQAANFYDSGIQKLGPRLNVWTMPATMLKNSYVQAIHSQCRFCKLKMLYMVKTFVSLLSGDASYLRQNRH